MRQNGTTVRLDEDPATRNTVLEVDSLQMRYGGVLALNEVSLRVGAGEILGIIGPNGAGKTTLFDAISGLVRATKGTVRLDGVDASKRGASWRARNGLRRTFQRQQVFGALSVTDNLLAARESHGRAGGVLVDLVGLAGRRPSAADDRAAVDEMIQRCGIGDYRDEPAGVLPIGAARMVELARALIGEPSVLLLDEPTSGLGQRETDLMGSVIRDVRSEGRCGVLLVEHDMRFVMDLSDRVMVLHMGEQIADGVPADVQRDPAVKAAYLGE